MFEVLVIISKVGHHHYFLFVLLINLIRSRGRPLRLIGGKCHAHPFFVIPVFNSCICMIVVRSWSLGDRERPRVVLSNGDMLSYGESLLVRFYYR